MEQTSMTSILGFGPIERLFLFAFLLSILLGWVARRSDFCTLGSIADIMKGHDSGRLRMYLFAIAVAIFGAAMLEFFQLVSFNDTSPHYRMAEFQWAGYLVGGLLFGFGMTLSNGCAMKTVVNLGSGNLKSVATLTGIGISTALMLHSELFYTFLAFFRADALSINLIEHGILQQDLGSLLTAATGLEVQNTRFSVALLIVTALVAFVLSSKDFYLRSRNWLGGFMVGFLIVLAFYLSGGPLGEAAMEASDFLERPQNGIGMQSFTFVRPAGDLAYLLTSPQWNLMTFGVIAFLGVVAGAALINIFARSFHWQWFSSWRESIRYFAGGILLGIGGMLGMGCAIGQGIAGTSTLALGSFLNFAMLLLGVYIGIRTQPRFLEQHQLPIECVCSVGVKMHAKGTSTESTIYR